MVPKLDETGVPLLQLRKEGRTRMRAQSRKIIPVFCMVLFVYLSLGNQQQIGSWRSHVGARKGTGVWSRERDVMVSQSGYQRVVGAVQVRRRARKPTAQRNQGWCSGNLLRVVNDSTDVSPQDPLLGRLARYAVNMVHYWQHIQENNRVNEPKTAGWNERR